MVRNTPKPVIQNELTDLTVGAIPIGGIYDMNHDHSQVTSNDETIHAAGGISQGAFLLAVPARDQEDPNQAILLRVTGRATLPDEPELVRIREETTRAHHNDNAYGRPDGITRSELQRVAYNTTNIGTFYTTQNGVAFGNDVPTIRSYGEYVVLKPSTDALTTIASFPLNENDGIRIGRVRYDSTELTPTLNETEVRINVDDIVGNKVGLFGMTRTGKSNTVKMIVTDTLKYAIKTDTKIGQLLFDPSGEYANPNTQDEEALAEIGDEAVSIYSWDATDNTTRKPLRMNFFEEDQIDHAWDLIKTNIARDADYVRDFKATNPIGPDNPNGQWSQYNRSGWQRSALYATLARAGFDLPTGFRNIPNISTDIVDLVSDQMTADLATTNGNDNPILNEDTLVEFWRTVYDLREVIEDEVRDDWFDTDLIAMLTMLEGSVGSGYRILKSLRAYHSPNVTGFFGDNIYRELCEGRVVIVDVHNETSSAVQHTVERIVRMVFNRAVDRFAQNQTPPNIQIYLEEAHRFLSRDYIDNATDDDPYKNLAFEGARNHVGLVYATQQVSNVDHHILSQTHNIFVTYLNNDKEMRTLAGYYNFGEYEDLIRNSPDVGFVVMTTESRRYLIPTQIDEFNADHLNETRALVDAAVSQDRMFTETSDTEEVTG